VRHLGTESTLRGGTSPGQNGFPSNNKNVRVRGQADPYTQHKRDGAPLRNGTTFWSWEFGYTRPSGSRGPAQAEITANTVVKTGRSIYHSPRVMGAECPCRSSAAVSPMPDMAAGEPEEV